MKKDGITLIALIITIVVLLILAGVSISIMTGDNGLLSQAQDSKVKTDKAHIQEMKDLTSARAAMNLEGYTDEKTGVYIPSGFAVSENPDEQTIEKGLVIIDKMGDEFVWVPVDIPEGKTIKDVFKRIAGKNGYSVTASGEQTSPDVSELKDDYGNNVLLKNSDSSEISTNDVELNLVKNAGGFFISRYEIGLDGSIQRELIRPSGNTQDVGNFDINYYENSADTSASKYWFDAREADKALSNDCTTNRQAIIDRILPQIQSKQGIEPVRRMTQDECLWLANEWKSGKDHQSGLVTGRTWDTALNWSCNTAEQGQSLNGYTNADNNCQEWGNYYNSSSVTYKNIFHSGENGLWIEGFFEKPLSTRSVFPTGEFVNSANLNTTAKNNIYDMAGNVCEWTTEIPNINDANRVIRGGSASDNGNSNPATRRRGNGSGIKGYSWDVGFRCVLYVTK